MTNERSVTITAPKVEGKSSEYAVARTSLEPELRHAALATNASADLFKGDAAGLPNMAEALSDMAGEAASQDMTGVGRVLTAQALSLDALFTQMVRRAHAAIDHYPDATERYMRLAFKAQAQSRATLEALVKLHQPREQTVRHIHVGPDGQAVFIENLHGGLGNARFDDRPHAQSASGPSLLSHDTCGNGLPIPGSEGPEPLPHARGSARKRRPNRQPQCVETRSTIG